MKKRVLLCWSSGKDSVWALHVLRQKNEFDVVERGGFVFADLLSSVVEGKENVA